MVEVRSLRRSPAKYIRLLRQDRVFRLQRCSRLKARSQDTENQLEQIGHQDASLRRPLAASTPNRIFGTHRWPTTSTVSACKAAVSHLARILSAELVDRGIRVNTLSPGPTDTAMFARFAGEEQGNAVKGVLATNNPSKRMADPSEIAKLAVYLASDDSAYIVGADFLIDGGVSAISPVGA